MYKFISIFLFLILFNISFSKQILKLSMGHYFKGKLETVKVASSYNHQERYEFIMPKEDYLFSLDYMHSINNNKYWGIGVNKISNYDFRDLIKGDIYSIYTLLRYHPKYNSKPSNAYLIGKLGMSLADFDNFQVTSYTTKYYNGNFNPGIYYSFGIGTLIIKNLSMDLTYNQLNWIEKYNIQYGSSTYYEKEEYKRKYKIVSLNLAYNFNF